MEAVMEEKIQKALEIAMQYGGIDEAHHKQWCIDQMVRALTGCPMVEREAIDAQGKPYLYECQGRSSEYDEWVQVYMSGEDGPETYEWDEGIAP